MEKFLSIGCYADIIYDDVDEDNVDNDDGNELHKKDGRNCADWHG